MTENYNVVVEKPSHIKWLIDTGERLSTADGKEIEVWEFQHEDNDTILSEWATHFRNHYCLDSEIDELVSGTGKTKSQYLTEVKFPDCSEVPGPSIRSGDFAEILIADYLEFYCNYWIPRLRYNDKTIRNESKKGSDIIGFKVTSLQDSPNDEMVIFEVKASFSDTKDNRLQDAVDGSNIDEIRRTESLNALKQRFVSAKESQNAKKIERFQNAVARPYKEISGAAAVLEKSVFDKTNFSTVITSKHYNHSLLLLIVVKGEKMMPLVHKLYRRAADEA